MEVPGNPDQPELRSEEAVLQRHGDWFGLLKVGKKKQADARDVIEHAYANSQGMMHRIDVESLVAAALHCQPKRVFEIGTFKGASSDMLLRLLPDAHVTSIAFASENPTKRQYNNDQLRISEVGALVGPEHRGRFTQLIGDSHKIDPEAFVQEHGRMDLVFIDGDHSREGVRQDTELAHAILAPGGAIAWHDANPKRRYIGSRQFLEDDMAELALATTDDFQGGVAFWTEKLERQLRKTAA
ncbi:MAG: class I SAM-dependent methyltransferase [Tabrizicola sp.]